LTPSEIEFNSTINNSTFYYNYLNIHEWGTITINSTYKFIHRISTKHYFEGYRKDRVN
jgi:hypothetical protein